MAGDTQEWKAKRSDPRGKVRDKDAGRRKARNGR
jgi:hypothetical protein